MGYSTDYIGRIDIQPALNASERDYLNRFSRSRRWDRPEGPYALTSTRENSSTDTWIRRRNRPAAGQPSLWCQWIPCLNGCCVTFDGHEKFYAGPAWMRYLIDEFLRPGAAAMGSGHAEFADFTFDHRADGLISGCRRDNRELFAIDVHDNEVSVEVLTPGDPGPLGARPYAELPYAREIDRRERDFRLWLSRRTRRSRILDDPMAS